MSPEALQSSVEPATDVWAAGVMAYQLLSGRVRERLAVPMLTRFDWPPPFASL